MVTVQFEPEELKVLTNLIEEHLREISEEREEAENPALQDALHNKRKVLERVLALLREQMTLGDFAEITAPTL